MKEYISKDYLNSILISRLNNSNGAENYAYGCIKQEIQYAPESEIAHIKHGYWVKLWCDNNMIGHEYEECSVCGCAMLDTNQFWDSNFCPNCGAIMKENSNGRN